MTILILATGNPGKLKELRAYLAGMPWELQLKPSNLTIEETGTTFRANARLKASQVAQATGHWAIADDSGLEVAALGGDPGVHSARYGATDNERIQRLLGALANQQNRQAQFVCVVAIARPNGTIALEAEGICPGRILSSPQGDDGFGYDSVFYVSTLGQTFAEMDPALKRSCSHRGRAMAQLLPQLRALSPLQ